MTSSTGSPRVETRRPKKPLQTAEKRPKDAEPSQDPFKGDLDPVYIEWYRRNFTAAQFRAKYAKRLARMEKNQ